MVAAVRCPNPKCRKYMLVEDADQGNVVPCLICKQSVKVPKAGATSVPQPRPPAPVGLESTSDLTPIFDDDEPQFKLD
jgi:hypothetical protein